MIYYVIRLNKLRNILRINRYVTPFTLRDLVFAARVKLRNNNGSLIIGSIPWIFKFLLRGIFSKKSTILAKSIIRVISLK